MSTNKNYITPLGLSKLQSELHELVTVERPKVTEVVTWAASNGDRSENADYHYGKKKLREIDKRIRYLNKHIESAEVIDPAVEKSDQVKFGATVTIKNEDGELKTYSIVGVDEVDISRSLISWQSPLGSALLKHYVGDYVIFKSPGGEQEIEIIKIEYKRV